MNQATDFWKISDELGNLLASAPISLAQGEGDENEIRFTANKAVGIEEGDVLYVASPFGSPVYKVEVTQAPMQEGDPDVPVCTHVIGVS